MNDLELITLESYCKRAKVWSMFDMIQYHVQVEDIHNHPFIPIEIPKGMKYPVKTKFQPASLHAFMKEFVGILLP